MLFIEAEQSFSIDTQLHSDALLWKQKKWKFKNTYDRWPLAIEDRAFDWSILLY